MLKKIRFSELSILYFTILFFALTLIGLTYKTSLGQNNSENFLNYYLKIIFGPINVFLIWLAVIGLIGFSIKFSVFLLNAVKNGEGAANFLSKTFLKNSLKTLLLEFKTTLKISGLIILMLVILTAAVSKLNILVTNSLKDELILRWDYSLTGSYPFLSLQSLTYPPFFLNATIFSFTNFAVFLIASAIYIFYTNRKIFFELATAFCLELILMFPIWFYLPALSPQDRLIENIYRLPIPQEIKPALQTYHPQKEVVDFLNSVRNYKEGFKNLPTTTFPSAHVAWTVILAFYLFRLNWLLALMVSPVLALSILGTVFLAQHYFVDIPAGILVAIIAFYLTSIYFRYLRRHVPPPKLL